MTQVIPCISERRQLPAKGTASAGFSCLRDSKSSKKLNGTDWMGWIRVEVKMREKMSNKEVWMLLNTEHCRLQKGLCLGQCLKWKPVMSVEKRWTKSDYSFQRISVDIVLRVNKLLQHVRYLVDMAHGKHFVIDNSCTSDGGGMRNSNNTTITVFLFVWFVVWYCLFLLSSRNKCRDMDDQHYIGTFCHQHPS